MNYKNNLISVIIPIYNVEKYLSRCLDSIIENTYKELEVICVNDGSPDHCREILDKYKQQDSRIIVIDKQNEGLSAARNSGLKAASGEFVAFIDSDDWIHPKYFEYLLRAITEHNADMSMCKFKTVKDGDILTDAEYKSNLITVTDLAKTGFNYTLPVWGKLFRSTAVEGIYFDKDVKIEDVDYIGSFLIKNPGLRMANLNIALYAYYVRGDSLARKIVEEDFLQVCEKYIKYIDITDSKIIKAILSNYALKSALIARFAFIALGDKEKINRSNAIIRKCLIHRFKLHYVVLAAFPSIYRFIMIKIDPTLKTYEKNLKKSRYNRGKQ